MDIDDLKSNVKGVCWIKSAKKWRVTYSHEGLKIHVGEYVSKDTAEAVREALDIVMLY